MHPVSSSEVADGTGDGGARDRDVDAVVVLARIDGVYEVDGADEGADAEVEAVVEGAEEAKPDACT